MAIFLVGGSALLTGAVLAGWTQFIDDAVVQWMEAIETPWLVAVSKAFARSGSVPLVLVVIIGGFSVLVRPGRLVPGLFWLAMVAVTIGLSESVEEIIARPRPTSSLIIKSSFSYPSGHTMVSGVAIGIGLAAFASVLWPNRHRGFFAFGIFYVVAMAISRVYLRAHWLTDVVAGLAFGLVVLSVALALWRRSRALPHEVGLE